MTTYHVMVETKDKGVKEALVELLNAVQKKYDFTLTDHEHEDEPTEEKGSYILWYLSPSHNKVRYYVGPPPGPMQKPVWSYDKKEAAKLSKKACELVSQYIASGGYKIPLNIDKGGPDLKLINGGAGPKTQEELEKEFLAQGGVKLMIPAEALVKEAGEENDPDGDDKV